MAKKNEIHDRNYGSEKVMIKSGMIKETELKDHIILHNKLHDRLEYRITQ
jgi:RimJ/RimL family protein N-acetyltransferase